jgi:uncharacterized protein (DUF302 family)
MKKVIALLAFVLAGVATIPAIAQEGMVIVQGEYSVEETTDRLEKILKDNGLTIFKKVNHQEGAASVNLSLPPTTVLIFGNPKLGTPLMQCAPTTAIDLPQKMLIWEDTAGKVKVAYNAPDYLKKRHRIEGCDQELQKISDALQKFAQSAAKDT